MTNEEKIRGALLQARIQINAGLLDSADRFIALALSALAAPAPQEEQKLDTQAVYGPAAERRYLNPTPPAREDVPPAMRRLVAIVSDLDARGEVEPIVVDGVRAVVREHLATPASAPEGDKP